jgi:hypothetical protein
MHEILHHDVAGLTAKRLSLWIRLAPPADLISLTWKRKSTVESLATGHLFDIGCHVPFPPVPKL